MRGSEVDSTAMAAKRKRYQPGESAGEIGRPRSMTGAWADLAAKYATLDELAVALGVARSTVYKWSQAGIEPRNGIVRDAVNAFFKSHGIRSPYR